ncbi:MAG: DUF6143 family protein [Bacillota bacterium]|nr:DUF6143 family protein [Bacillota bacterium]
MFQRRPYFGDFNNQYLPPRVATMPNSLYQSLQGKYFVGYADNLTFGNGTSAWAGLINPKNSNVNLHVNVYTITDFAEPPIDVQVWFNAALPGNPVGTKHVTPANTAIYPLPAPNVRLLSASNVTGLPQGGVNAASRRSIPGQTIAEESNGIYIFPPGGSFTIFLTNVSGVETPGIVRVAFGWWEEHIYKYY